MTKLTLTQQKARLLAERESLLLELARLRETLQTEVDLEPDEGDEQITEHETAAILLAILEHKLLDIEAAVLSIEQGEYSQCERCGRPIESERLVAKPDARFCINCQAIVERIVRNQMPALSVQWELFADV